MRTTTTLHQMIYSELENKGYNEFINEKGELVFFDSDSSFMKKIMVYDNDVHAIVTQLFFQNYSFPEPIDKEFKEQFLKTFLNREIKFQGVDMFSMEVFTTSKKLEPYIKSIYTDLDKYILNQSETETTGNNDRTSKNKTTNLSLSEVVNTSLAETENDMITNNRSFDGQLPDSELNLDLNNDTTSWGGHNTISKNNQNGNSKNTGKNDTKNKGENDTLSDVIDKTVNDSKTITKEFSLQRLKERMSLLDGIFDIYDKKCFLQVW